MSKIITLKPEMTVEIVWINAIFDTRDQLHDSIADATDGTEPRFYFEGIGWVVLLIEVDTGSTLCKINDEEVIYLGELLDKLEGRGVNYGTSI